MLQKVLEYTGFSMTKMGGHPVICYPHMFNFATKKTLSSSSFFLSDKENSIFDENILVEQPKSSEDEGCVFVEKQTIVHEISLEMCPDEDPSVENLSPENEVDTENEVVNPDDSDEFVEQQQIVQQSMPEVDFSVLGEPEDYSNVELSGEPTNNENEDRALSPYELSIQRVQQEEEEAWEREHEEIPRDYGSKTPVDEEDIMDEKEEREEMPIDLEALEHDEENVDSEPVEVMTMNFFHSHLFIA